MTIGNAEIDTFAVSPERRYGTHAVPRVSSYVQGTCIISVRMSGANQKLRNCERGVSQYFAYENYCPAYNETRLGQSTC